MTANTATGEPRAVCLRLSPVRGLAHAAKRPRREVKARPKTYQICYEPHKGEQERLWCERGGLVSDAVPLEHGALAPTASVATARREAVANEFDGDDGHALPTQIEAELERLVVYADAQERKVSQLQAALDSRVAIEQAIGILAERFGLPFSDAFELLRAAARNSRRKVRALAEELGASRETPPDIAELLPSSDDEAAEYVRCPSCGTPVVVS